MELGRVIRPKHPMKEIKKLAILGGGTAGWMCAAYLSKFHTDLDITLIESSKIGAIGVGEGSTPHLKQFMQQLGIAEQQWMPYCDATFKAGIYFKNWNGDQRAYFHPFYSEMDINTAEVFFVNANARRRGHEQWCGPDSYFLTGHLAKNALSPKAKSPMVREQHYGYHFDAKKLAHILKCYAIERDVTHIDDEFVAATTNAQGEISNLKLKHSAPVNADFYIDASGFNALLIGETLGCKFQPFTEQLLNDSAVTIACPQNMNQPLPAATHSTALSAGWLWQIPLTSRIGTGYVYSSAFLSKQQAEQELAATLNISVNDVEFRHVSMKVGARSCAWQKNVMAIGLAQSFIEPLEATSLMVTQQSILWLSKAISKIQTSPTQTEKLRLHTNQQLHYLVNGIKDYICAHYATSKRRDSAYWRAVTQTTEIPTRLEPLLAAWRNGDDFDAYLYHQYPESVYSRPSWYSLLAGMDYRDSALNAPTESAQQEIDLAAHAYLESLCSKHFEPHIMQLKAMRQNNFE